ncbi:MauE/DoxX family redox-associated membrane protein [Kitasatospora sp. NBC_01302]|uniref:MauE/DoxX family redox-associated membrane protein n=1 Tax=Kitasatospora sp. NBC_01302 TaxID=2903575 RepID=UPI002E15D7F1|nr:methylamine utilization protein MauE [Kitasatospora sp. NBC_01302]
MDVVTWVSRGCLLLVFALSVHGKVRGRRAFEEFTESVRALVPAFADRARPLAALVVAAEATIVVTLAVPGSAVAGLALCAVLLAAFTVLAVTASRAGSSTPCRCFGRSSTPLGTVHAVRNAALLALAGAGLTATVLSGPGHAAPATTATAATAFLAGGVLGLLASVLDDLVALFRPLP